MGSLLKGKAVVERPIGDEMTLKEIRNYLGSIRLINDGRGNRVWQEVTVRQHNIARRLGFPDLYRELPDWGPKPEFRFFCRVKAVLSIA